MRPDILRILQGAGMRAYAAWHREELDPQETPEKTCATESHSFPPAAQVDALLVASIPRHTWVPRKETGEVPSYYRAAFRSGWKAAHQKYRRVPVKGLTAEREGTLP